VAKAIVSVRKSMRRCFLEISADFRKKVDKMKAVKEAVEQKNMNSADEVREFPRGRLELVTVGGVTFGRATFQSGWKWSESVQPLVKTKSCEAPHTQYQVQGRMRVKMDDGVEHEFGPGDVSYLPTGHDAWVVGDESVVVIDVVGMTHYAERE
jgi:hypothetical protein